MSQPPHQSVSRRGFLTATAAVGAVLSALALSSRGAGATPPSAAAQDATCAQTVAQPADPLAARLKRTEVQRGGFSIAGREIVQMLTEIPAGVESGWHTHPGEEVGYILAGLAEIMVKGQPTRTLRAGDGVLIPPRTPHSVISLGPETVQMLSTYIVEEGQPLVALTC